MNAEKFRKLLISAGVSAVGAALAYVSGVLASGELDLGIYGPLVAAGAAWLTNLVREYLKPAAPVPPVAV